MKVTIILKEGKASNTILCNSEKEAVNKGNEFLRDNSIKYSRRAKRKVTIFLTNKSLTKF